MVDDAKNDGSLKWVFTKDNGPYEVREYSSHLLPVKILLPYRHSGSSLCMTQSPIWMMLK